MTPMTITLTTELEARLTQKASEIGREPQAVAEELLTAALDWEAQDHAEAIEGIRRGLDAGANGRVRPAAEVFADLRECLSLPK